jgi:pseudouridine synthase
MAMKRVQLIIRDAGICSRRKAEELILEGRVTVNGQVVEHPGVMADPEKDYIKVDGKLLRQSEPAKVYYLFNKPRNVVSTFSDPQGRPCVGDVVKKIKKKGLFTVGRLDFDAEGLMILTNDGALAQTMGHPSSAIPRTYLVKVGGEPSDKELSTICKGMSIGEGDRLGDVQVRVIKRQKTSTWIRVVLFEGKRNEIKRIFAKIKHPARRIRRIGFGPFSLGTLAVGAWRPLTTAERAAVTSLGEKRGGKS